MIPKKKFGQQWIENSEIALVDAGMSVLGGEMPVVVESMSATYSEMSII